MACLYYFLKLCEHLQIFPSKKKFRWKTSPISLTFLKWEFIWFSSVFSLLGSGAGRGGQSQPCSQVVLDLSLWSSYASCKTLSVSFIPSKPQFRKRGIIKSTLKGCPEVKENICNMQMECFMHDKCLITSKCFYCHQHLYAGLFRFVRAIVHDTGVPPAVGWKLLAQSTEFYSVIFPPVHITSIMQ